MNQSKAYQTWISAGYELFSQEGYEGIQIERLARIVDLNKSGFYHYFGNRDTYFKHLMKHHLHYAGILVETVQSIRSFVPEYIQFLNSFRTPVLAQMQLMRENHHPLFAKTFDDVNKIVDVALLPIWAEFIGIPENPALALRYFEFFRDMFYARMNKHNLSYEMMHSICLEAKDICLAFKNSENSKVISVTSA